jgi:2-dehydropantoate 2-reductase
MKPLEVLVAGSGAIGGYFGALLVRGGHRVTMLARGPHLAALRADGLRIAGGPDEGAVAVESVEDLSEAPAPDLVLFAVKTYDTTAVAEALRPRLHDDSIVLGLQNGVDRAEAIGEIVGGDRVLAGTVFMESVLEAPGVVRYLSGARRIVFGEPHGVASDRVRRVHEVLLDAGINAEAPGDVRPQLWTKYALVCAANALTALTRRPFGGLLQAPGGRQVITDLIAEVVTIARAKGVALDDDIVPHSVAFLEGMGPKLRSSMLRDIERGRRVEVDALNGHVVALSDELGLPAPANRVVALTLSLYNDTLAEQIDKTSEEDEGPP